MSNEAQTKTYKSLKELGFSKINYNNKEDYKEYFDFNELKYIKEIWINHPQARSDQLFILIHGWQRCADHLTSVAGTILKDKDIQFTNAIVVVPELKAGFFSVSKPETIVQDIVALIDSLNDHKTIKNIYLIGHSIGALITRQVYLCAYEKLKNSSDLTNKEKWVEKVDRIILLAGINRGWTTTPAFKWFYLLGTDFLTIIDTLLYGFTKNFLICNFRSNSPFITNLRFQWMDLLKLIKQREKQEVLTEVLTIQLLGTQDDYVSPQDDIDFITGQNFRYIEVPKTNHLDIINLNENQDRKEKFKLALILQQNTQEPSILTIQDLEDQSFPFPKAQDKITDVIFVIHGIRDRGFWTKKIARKIKLLGNKDGGQWATETSTYGFFGFLPFLLSYHRQNKVQWLMEQYIENKALYPNARFHYVGHSNGTYILAKALEDYPWCKFHHIIFAGSVVTQKYNWEERIKNKQVEKILNFVATGDWVVGIFPNLLGKLPVSWWKYFGGGGYEGFNFTIYPEKSQDNEVLKYETNEDEKIHQIKFIVGDHGAGLTEDNWQTIADFIVRGEVVINGKSIKEIDWKTITKDKDNIQKLFHTTRGKWTEKIVSYFSPIIWILIVLLIVLVFCLLKLSPAIFLIVVFILWQFLTRI